MPATKASATIWVALEANGRTKNTPARAASATTRIQRRETASSRRPVRNARRTLGRNSTTSRALTHEASSVRSKTSTTRATKASQVPMLDASVARKRRRYPPASRKSPNRALLRPPVTVRTVTAAPAAVESSNRGMRALQDALEGGREKGVLLLRADRHPDRLRRAERRQRANDHPFMKQAVEERVRVLAGLDVDEVRHRRSRHGEPERAARIRELGATAGRLGAPASDFRVVADARARGVLGGLVHVEGVSHLGDGLDDLDRADAVSNPEAGEPVDLRERPQHEGAPAGLDGFLDPIGIVLGVHVLEIRLVQNGEDVRRDLLEIRVDRIAPDHRPGRVVGVAEVNDLRPATDRAEDRLDVIAVVREWHPLGDGSELERIEDVAREARPAADDLVSRVEQRERQVHEHGIRPGRQRHVLHVDAVALGERAAQKVGAAVRVAVELGRAPLDRLERLREGPVLALVGRKLDNPFQPEFTLHLLHRLARFVRDEALEGGSEER